MATIEARPFLFLAGGLDLRPSPKHQPPRNSLPVCGTMAFEPCSLVPLGRLTGIASWVALVVDLTSFLTKRLARPMQQPFSLLNPTAFHVTFLGTFAFPPIRCIVVHAGWDVH